LDGADEYLFILKSDSLKSEYTVPADRPWKDLSPIWDLLPTGMVSLKVEGVKDGKAIGLSGQSYTKILSERNMSRLPAWNGWKNRILISGRIDKFRNQFNG
jgi:hypothetical protein